MVVVTDGIGQGALPRPARLASVAASRQSFAPPVRRPRIVRNQDSQQASDARHSSQLESGVVGALDMVKHARDDDAVKRLVTCGQCRYVTGEWLDAWICGHFRQ